MIHSDFVHVPILSRLTRRVERRGAGSIALLAAWLLAAPACSHGNDPGAIRSSGHVEATDVRVSTKVGGILDSLQLREGDRVAAGQAIAEIDTIDTRLALDAARAERDAADADLRLRQAGSRPEEIAEGRAHVQVAKADLEGAQRELDRMQGLVDSGSGTEKSRDDALTRRDVAANALRAAEERLRRLEAGSRRQEIDAARARLSAAEARIAQLEQQITDASIKCPVAGVVTEKLVEQGELLKAGTALVVVTDLSDAWLNIYVGEPDVARIRIGQEAEVVTDDGQSRKGHVSFVASEAEFTPKNVQTQDERVKLVFKVKIALDNGDGLFKPGMPAEARLTAAGEGA